MMQQISKTTIAERLDAVLGEAVGLKGLGILLYGWTRKDRNLRVNICHRKWLYAHEVRALSDYAGYDLMPAE